MSDIFKDAAALEAKFNEIGYAVQRQVLIKAARKGAQLIRDEAEKLAPRRTGALAKSQIVTIAGTGSNSAEVVVKIGPDRARFYGLFQELGTAHHSSQPFLKPALESQHDAALDVAREVLLDAIEKVTG